jgi:hypothetical protein
MGLKRISIIAQKGIMIGYSLKVGKGRGKYH